MKKKLRPFHGPKGFDGQIFTTTFLQPSLFYLREIGRISPKILSDEKHLVKTIAELSRLLWSLPPNGTSWHQLLFGFGSFLLQLVPRTSSLNGIVDPNRTEDQRLSIRYNLFFVSRMGSEKRQLIFYHYVVINEK